MSDAILIQPKDKQEMKFWLDLIQRVQAMGVILHSEDIEDLNLGLLMQKERTSEFVDRKDVLDLLQQ